MPTLSPLTVAYAWGLALVLCRIGGLVVMAPALGAWVLPIRFRLMLALAIALVVGPVCLGYSSPPPQPPIAMAVLAGGEIMIGAALGLGVAILLSFATLAGQLIGQLSGASLSNVLHPDGSEAISAHAQLLYLVALAVYVALGGPRLLMGAVLGTFRELPPGSAVSAAGLSDTLVTLLGQSFQLGIRAAAPALAALLLATIALAVVGRSVPQLGVLSMSMGINSLVALAVTLAAVGLTVHLLGHQLEPTLTAMVESIGDRSNLWETNMGLSP